MFKIFSVQDFSFIKFFYVDGQDKQIVEHFHVKTAPAVMIHWHTSHRICVNMKDAKTLISMIEKSVMLTGLINIGIVKCKQNFAKICKLIKVCYYFVALL